MIRQVLCLLYRTAFRVHVCIKKYLVFSLNIKVVLSRSVLMEAQLSKERISVQFECQSLIEVHNSEVESPSPCVNVPKVRTSADHLSIFERQLQTSNSCLNLAQRHVYTHKARVNVAAISCYNRQCCIIHSYRWLEKVHIINMYW